MSNFALNILLLSLGCIKRKGYMFAHAPPLIIKSGLQEKTYSMINHQMLN